MTSTQEEQRAEVEAVLSSGIFDKAPRLGKFFGYICERHFDGEAHQIKEYSIATEALGRGEDFDPKKDSIVRVEAHRLRKRLQEYYKVAGRHRELRIDIPNGQYRPEFIVCSRDTVLAHSCDGRGSSGASVTVPVEGLNYEQSSVASPRDFWRQNGFHVEPNHAETNLVETNLVERNLVETIPGKLALQPPGWLDRSAVLWILATLLAAVLVVFALHIRSDVKERQRQAVVQTALTSDAEAQVLPLRGAEFRMLAGYRGPAYADIQGHVWLPDAFYTGGSAKLIPSGIHIEGQPDRRLIRSFRLGKFRYDIPLSSGTYELHLLFAETELGARNQGNTDSLRTFQILVNNALVFPEFDSVSRAGAPNRLDEQVLKDVEPASDHKLHLAFNPLDSQGAMLSAIEILPSAPGRVHPVRILTQLTPSTDSEGRQWAADEYFVGGAQVDRFNTQVRTPEHFLYEGERFGNFSYRIPLAQGKYKLTLHFAEQWFGTLFSRLEPVADRAFDVFANRSPLVRDFAPAIAAHGPNLPVALTFDKVAPNAQGVLLLEFVPIRNYAEINAIEVVQAQ